METSLMLTDALREFDWATPDSATYDIAEANLRCAIGLPGAEGLDLNACLLRLDGIAADVGRIILQKANYDLFLNDPGRFHHSQAYFCVVCMISVLKSKYGAEYNPKWFNVVPEKPIPDDFGKDAKDQFIHAILNGEGGTCGSLPVFFVAVGRRIGLPLKLVKALRHLFIRWDDPSGSWLGFSSKSVLYKGEVFNIEATGAEIHRLSDEEYRSGWPHPIPQECLDTGIYLNSMTAAEELAEFLAQRANCFYYNDRIADSYAALKWCVRLAPHNSIRKARLERLADYFEASRRETHFYQRLDPTEPATTQPVVETRPRWVQMNDGTRALMQILNPAHLTQNGTATHHTANVGISLRRHHLQLPNGHNAWAEVPTYSAHQPMAAFWIQLSMNEFALVHKLLPGIHTPDINRIGQPILPVGPQPWAPQSAMTVGHAAGTRPQEPQRLSPSEESALRIAATRGSTARSELPQARFTAIDFVPTHAHLRPIPCPHGPRLRLQT
jgi:hypothetical protein